MTDVEHAKKYAEESISLAISMYNPKAEDIARMACLYGLTYKNEQIAKLEKENAELKKKLKEKLKTIADKDLSFVAKFDALEKENAELKEDNDARKFAMAMSEKVEKQLRKENAELKERADEADLDSVTFFNQLTIAKKFIKDYMIIVKSGHITVCSVPEENRCINVLKLNEQAEQFIKDSEVKK